MTKRRYYRSNVELKEPLTQEEEKKYIKLLKEGDQNAREILVTRNLRLVIYIAKKFENTGIGMEDLISIGTIGLIKGVNTFNADKNIKLATYTSKCIENEILMYLRKNNKVKEEISIYEPLAKDCDGNEFTIQEILQDQSADLNKILEKTGNMEDVKKVLEYILNDFHDKKKLYILYHLIGYTQKQIGEKYKMSQSAISRSIRAIKKTLKKRCRNNKRCNCDRYKVAIENKFYKISFTIEEPEKYQLCKDIISKTKYQAYYNDLKREVLITIDAENEALKLLTQIVECIEDIKY